MYHRSRTWRCLGAAGTQEENKAHCALETSTWHHLHTSPPPTSNNKVFQLQRPRRSYRHTLHKTHYQRHRCCSSSSLFLILRALAASISSFVFFFFFAATGCSSSSFFTFWKFEDSHSPWCLITLDHKVQSCLFKRRHTQMGYHLSTALIHQSRVETR